MLVKIEARILIFPGTDFHFPSTPVPPGMFFRLSGARSMYAADAFRGCSAVHSTEAKRCSHTVACMNDVLLCCLLRGAWPLWGCNAFGNENCGCAVSYNHCLSATHCYLTWLFPTSLTGFTSVATLLSINRWRTWVSGICKIWRPEVEHVTRGRSPSVTCSTVGRPIFMSHE